MDQKLKATDIQGIKVSEMWVYGRMEKVGWVDRKRNEEVLTMHCGCR